MDEYLMADANLPATDRAALDRLHRFGGAKLLHEMIRLFLEAGPERLDAAHAGLTADDADATERALHSLKSSAAQLGALRLQRLSEHGERLAKAGALGEVSRMMDEMQQELTRVREWLVQARDEATA